MTNSERTLGELIDLAMQMEEQAWKFYDALETTFKDNSEFNQCMAGIKDDETMHLRVLSEIRQSLSPVRLQSVVGQEVIDTVQQVLTYMEGIDFAALTDVEDVIEAIRTLEQVEFDVVLSFVDINEITFDFTREYLKNESLDHSNRIYLAQQCLD